MTATLLKNGRVIDPANSRDEVADVLVGADGNIGQVGPNLDAGPDVPVLDCTGQVVAPGLIDMHVHLRVPGQEYKEDVPSGTAAAANGGFTAIVCQPNTRPAIDHASIVKDILAQARDASARVHVIGAVSMGLENKELTEMADLKDAGVVGIGDDAFPVHDSGFLRRAMEYCRMLDLPYIAHCEDKDLTGDGVMNEGYVSTVLGLKGIPRSAENVGTARNVLLAMATGCRLHVLHVSTKESVEIIRHAKKFGAPVTCETCPQYVALTDEACYGYDTNAKMSPPLRTRADQDAVKQGLADGTIDAIATDHAPHAPHEKEQEFARVPFGMLGLETALGLVITHLVKPGVLTLAQAIEKMSTAPARILRVLGGTLSVGAPADITVFDPDAEWTVDVSQFKSKSRNSVLNGVTLMGRPVATFVGGRQICL
ncbi:MAG: dihydroorotase [Armatimonadetes bacterium]|nr:dihydroorotase [Armatimonadota bacterium]